MFVPKKEQGRRGKRRPSAGNGKKSSRSSKKEEL